MSKQSIVDDWGNSNVIDVGDDWSEEQKRKASSDWSLQRGKGPRVISPFPHQSPEDAQAQLIKATSVPPKVSEPSFGDWLGKRVEGGIGVVENTVQDIQDNFGSTIRSNAAEMAANEERTSAPDIERLGTLMSPLVANPVGEAAGLNPEPTIRDIHPNLVEPKPGEVHGIPQLRPAGVEAPVDMDAAHHRARGRATLDFASDPTNLGLMALTAIAPEVALPIGMGFATQPAAQSVDSLLHGEYRKGLGEVGLAGLMVGGGEKLPEGIQSLRERLGSIGDVPASVHPMNITADPLAFATDIPSPNLTAGREIIARNTPDNHKLIRAHTQAAVDQIAPRLSEIHGEDLSGIKVELGEQTKFDPTTKIIHLNPSDLNRPGMTPGEAAKYVLEHEIAHHAGAHQRGAIVDTEAGPVMRAEIPQVPGERIEVGAHDQNLGDLSSEPGLESIQINPDVPISQRGLASSIQDTAVVEADPTLHEHWRENMEPRAGFMPDEAKFVDAMKRNQQDHHIQQALDELAQNIDNQNLGEGLPNAPQGSGALDLGVEHKGLVPTSWMKEQGIKHTNKGWFDADGNPTDGQEIRRMFEEDLAAKKVAGRPPGPKPPAEVLPPGTPVSQPPDVPSLSEFMQKNPRMSISEIKAKYNELVQAFTDTQPKTIEQTMGDVGELPPDFEAAPPRELPPPIPDEVIDQSPLDAPTGDFVKDILEKPVETVQPPNDLPSPDPLETRIEAAKADAAAHPVEPARNQAEVDAAHEAQLADSANDFSWIDKMQADQTALDAQKAASPPIREEGMGMRDLGLPEEPTGDFVKDVLEKPIEAAPIEAPSPIEAPTGNFQKDVLEKPVETPPPTPEPIAENPKMSLDSILEEKFPGKESYTKVDIQAARKELMSRLRKTGSEKRATKVAEEQAAIDAEGTGEPPKKLMPVAVESDGKAPLMPLGSPGLVSRLLLDTRTNLAKIHPHLGKWFDKFQRESEAMSSGWIARRREITHGIKGSAQEAVVRILDTKEGEQMAVAHALQDRPKQYALLQQDPTLKLVLEEVTKDPTLIEKASKLRELQDEVHVRAEASKVAIGYREHHFPHYFADGGFKPNVIPQAMPKTGTTTRRMSKLEKSRLSMRKDYIKHLDVLDQYYQQAGGRISEAENFGKRHQKVAAWLDQTSGTSKPAAEYFDKAMQRITGNEEPAVWKSTLGKTRRLQALSDLGLAAPLQLGQISHTSAYGGVMRSLEGMRDMSRGERAIAMRAMKEGALTPDISIEALGAVRGKFTGGGFMWGVPTLDKAMRVHAFRVGELLHRDATSGNKGALRSLERLGVKNVSKATPEQIGKLLSDKTQFRTGQLDLPLWSSSPLGRTATMYTSFMYQHTKFMMSMMRNPVKNAAAIARFAIIGSIAGEGVNDIRAVLKGRNPVEDEKFRRQEAKWIEVLRNRRIPLTSPLKREVQNLATIGGAGVFQTYLERLMDPGQATLAKMAAGPLAANAEDLLSGIHEPKKGKDKLKNVGRWTLEQVPIVGYDLSKKLLPRKKRMSDPLMDVNY